MCLHALVWAGEQTIYYYVDHLYGVKNDTPDISCHRFLKIILLALRARLRPSIKVNSLIAYDNGADKITK